MPFGLRFIDSSQHFVRVELAGPLHPDLLHGVFGALVAERGQLRGVRIFSDATAVDSSGASPGDMMAIVQVLHDRPRDFAGMKWANYVGGSLVNLGMSNVAGMLTNELPFEYRPFQKRELAFNWLGVPPALWSEMSRPILPDLAIS